jgi:hypothetical protein
MQTFNMDLWYIDFYYVVRILCIWIHNITIKNGIIWLIIFYTSLTKLDKVFVKQGAANI